MGKKIDLTGERFGRLNVLSEVPERDRNKKVLWNCLCDCHKEFHKMYGRGDNTREQFKEYALNKTFVTN